MSSSELAFIDKLRLLATDPAARGLDDDVAVLDGLVFTHDMIAEGVHFLPTDPPASVGWKLVAVNLSDLAAKGAEPIAALMGMTLIADGDWEEKFLAGVAAACETYAIALVGGDTIALPEGAPRILGLTAIGRGGEKIPARSGGKAGDALWLVGTLGDAMAGLELLQEDAEAEGAAGRGLSPAGAPTCCRPPARSSCQCDDGPLRRAFARQPRACARPAVAEQTSTSTPCPFRAPLLPSMGSTVARD
jgi:thiamine-monophosphate kinase